MTTKIPAELSSTPSIVDNGNSTAMTIDSSEQIGIGSTAPNDYDNNSAGISSNLVVKDSGHSGIIVISGTSSDAAISFGDGTGTAAYRGAVAYVNSADALYFKAAGANKLRLDSDGLKFGSDTAAANALDDYEEGTFTPTVTSGITSVGYAVQTGYYTKIGNLVLFNLRIATSSGNAQSSTFAVGNLPFNSALTQQPGGAGVRAYASSFSSSGSQAFIGPASNSISFYTLAGTAFAGTSIVNHDDFDLRITGIYRA